MWLLTFETIKLKKILINLEKNGQFSTFLSNFTENEWEMNVYLQSSGDADGLAKQLRIFAKVGLAARRVGEHLGQTVVDQFDVDGGKLFVAHQILDDFAHVFHDHDGLPRLTADADHVRLFVVDKVSQHTNIFLFAYYQEKKKEKFWLFKYF